MKTINEYIASAQFVSELDRTIRTIDKRVEKMSQYGKLKRSPRDFLVENGDWNVEGISRYLPDILKGTSVLPASIRRFIKEVTFSAFDKVVTSDLKAQPTEA